LMRSDKKQQRMEVEEDATVRKMATVLREDGNSASNGRESFGSVSVVEVENGRSGSSSALLAPATGADDGRSSFVSVGTSDSWLWGPPLHRVDAARKSVMDEESSRLARARKEQRRAYVRRCAKAMLIFLALAALSLGTIYLMVEGDASLFNILPSSLRSGGLNEDGDEVVDEDAVRKLPQDLPQGGGGGAQWGAYQQRPAWREQRRLEKVQARNDRRLVKDEEAAQRRVASVQEEQQVQVEQQEQDVHAFDGVSQEEDHSAFTENYAAFDAHRMMMENVQQQDPRIVDQIFTMDFNQYPLTEEGQRALLDRLQQQQHQPV